MTKIQNSKNQIRDGQNVGEVPISMGAQSLIQKGQFGATNCWDPIFLEFWVRGP